MQTVPNSKLNCMGSKPHKHKYIDYTISQEFEHKLQHMQKQHHMTNT